MERNNEEQKQRRRLQNRLNQRARRLRIQKIKHANESLKDRPYIVGRWRFDTNPLHGFSRFESKSNNNIQRPISQPGKVPGQEIAVTDDNNIPVAGHNTVFTNLERPYQKELTLPADHLLSLIQYNVSRGLRRNKALLKQLVSYAMPSLPPLGVFDDDILFFGYSIITRASQNLPNCLAPTRSQMANVHSTWINILPFPKLRENLMNCEASFDHGEFMHDLVGGLVDVTRFTRPSPIQPPAPSRLRILHADDDEVTTGRNGLIIWGEPYLMESWEATPGFLTKWGWVVEGCQELIESSNRWRTARGEEAIKVSSLE